MSYIYRHDEYKNEADRIYQLMEKSTSSDELEDLQYSIKQLEYMDSQSPTNDELVEFARKKTQILPDFKTFKQRCYIDEYKHTIQQIKILITSYDNSHDNDLVYEIDHLTSDLFMIQECGESTPRYIKWK